MTSGDRNRQWEQLESRYRKNGNSRKNIKACKELFFEGKIGGSFDWDSILYLWPDPTIEGLQKLLDEVITDPLTDGDFITLQGYFCGVLSDYFCPIETQDYYFKATFGEVYDPNRVFPLRINREKEHRRLTYTPNWIVERLAFYFNSYMKWQEEGCGVLRLELPYFESLLPNVDQRLFTVDEPEAGKIDGLEIKLARASIQGLLKWPVRGRKNGLSAERITHADKVKASLMKNADQLGELRALEAKVMAELESQA